MGKKKASRAQARTFKKEKQLHDLMNVLRPKVYITDSSSFKQLVQELTWSWSGIIDIPEEVEKIAVMENIGIAAPSIAATSLDSSFCTFKSSEIAFQLEEINQESGGPMQTADRDMLMFNRQSCAFVDEPGRSDWSAYQNIESWLFDAIGSALIEQYLTMNYYTNG